MRFTRESRRIRNRISREKFYFHRVCDLLRHRGGDERDARHEVVGFVHDNSDASENERARRFAREGRDRSSRGVRGTRSIRLVTG